MEYTTVFSDQRRGPADTDFTKENFVRVSVYMPSNTQFPGLLKFEHGRRTLEEVWAVEWRLTTYIRELAIREAILLLDTYELGKPCGEIV